MTTEIRTKKYTITIDTDKDEIWISGIGKLKLILVGAGLPGIIGPNLEYNLADLVNKTNQEAIDFARSFSSPS